MDTAGLKENFHNQLKEIDEKIAQIQGELNKAQEYKLKLQGGLETLELLEKQEGQDLGDLPEETEE
jgi:prefoldin subunit 5